MSAGKQTPNGRVSGGAGPGVPTCPTCPFLLKDKQYPGWGWCQHSKNIVHGEGWTNGFTPSQSPDGSCELHPERAAAEAQQ